MAITAFTIIGFVVSALIVPAIVSYISSDYRVAQLQKRRNHYLELLKPFEKLMKEIGQFAPTDQPSPTSNTFIQRTSIPLTELLYSEQFKEHMTSGYPSIWENWNNLDSKVRKHNKDYADLMNEIGLDIKQIAIENGLEAIFPYYERDRPRFYVNLPKMAAMVYSEIEFRQDRYSDWFHCEPRYKDETHFEGGEMGYRWEQWGETAMMHDNFEEAEKFIQGYKDLVDSSLFNDRIIAHHNNREELEKERAEFGVLLQKEIEKIVLGDDLKGSCSICKRFRLI